MEKKLNRVNIQQWLDFDYLDKLTDKEKAWLSQFCSEYYSADFRTKDRSPLHKSKKKKREIYNSNNARNRDTTTLLSCYRMLDGMDKMDASKESEQELLELLDLMKKLSKNT